MIFLCSLTYFLPLQYVELDVLSSQHCDRARALKETGVCSRGTKQYACVTIPGFVVDTPDTPEPHPMCLGGNYSRGTCVEGKFLCLTKIRRSIVKCRALKRRALLLTSTERGIWKNLSCDILAAGYLGPNTVKSLSRIASQSENNLSSCPDQPLEAGITIVSVGSDPKEWFGSSMFCASLATKILNHYQVLHIRVKDFRFSEKPRRLLQVIDTFQPSHVIWFQDALDVFVAKSFDLPSIEAVQSFDLNSNQILFNGECNCFPRIQELCDSQARLFGAKGPHMFLNSGQFIARANTLKLFLKGLMKMIDENGGDWPTTDQGAFMEFCFGDGKYSAERLGLQCKIDSAAEVMRTMINCEGQVKVRSLHIPGDLSECRGSKKGRHMCLTDVYTQGQPTSFHFNVKSLNGRIEFNRIKPLIEFALNVSDKEEVKGCIYYSRPARPHNDLVITASSFSQLCPGFFDELLDGEIDVRYDHVNFNDGSNNHLDYCRVANVHYSCEASIEQSLRKTDAQGQKRSCLEISGLCTESSRLCKQSTLPVPGGQSVENFCEIQGAIYRCVSFSVETCLTAQASRAVCGENRFLCKSVCNVPPTSFLPTHREYVKENDCKPEHYVDVARNFLSSEFQGKLITNYMLSSYVNHSKNQYTIRIAILDNILYVQNYDQVADRHRADRVVEHLHKLLQHVKIPDVDLVLHVGDGVPEHAWPLETLTDKFKVPVFVQDMWPSANAILAPSRSSMSVEFQESLSRTSKVPWPKKIGKAVWRGSTTGALYTRANWRDQTRSKVVMLSRQRPDLLDAGFTNLKAQVDSDATMKEMEHAGMAGKWLSHNDQFNYKAIVVVDGNVVPDRLPSQLNGDSAIIKQQSERIEHWYTSLKDGENVIFVKSDVSDLEQVLELALRNDTKLKNIAMNGRKLIQQVLSRQAVDCYWVQLLEMYSQFVEKPVARPGDSFAYCRS
eukprot:656999-Hanusia_phi.AAC.3